MYDGFWTVGQTGCTDENAFNHDSNANQDDGSCIYYPDEFQFNQSQLQAFYIVENADIKQDDIEDLEILTDWIGVFKDSALSDAKRRFFAYIINIPCP